MGTKVWTKAAREAAGERTRQSWVRRRANAKANGTPVNGTASNLKRRKRVRGKRPEDILLAAGQEIGLARAIAILENIQKEKLALEIQQNVEGMSLAQLVLLKSKVTEVRRADSIN
jgi:hypothetical protein